MSKAANLKKKWVDVFCKTFLHEAVKFNWNKQKKLKLKMYKISLGKTRVKCIFPLLSVSKIHLQGSSDTSTATKNCDVHRALSSP